MERRINVSDPSAVRIRRKFSCLKVEMSDGKVYYLNNSINDFLKKCDEASSSSVPLITSFDVFDSRLCINPNFIKTIREGLAVVTATLEENNPNMTEDCLRYYIIGSSDEAIVCGEEERKDLSPAHQLFKPSDSFA